MKKRFLTAGAIAASTALAVSACAPGTGNDQASSGNKDAEVKVMWNQPFYSMNSSSNTGNATANTNVLYMMNDGFAYYDKDLKLQKNESFGTYEKVSDNPMKVKYTLADTAKWSDGTPVSAADLVLWWGSLSGKYNTKSADSVADENGNVKKQSGSNVVFNASDPGAALIKDFPEVSEDGKSVTFTYSKPFADWETVFTLGSGLPAHIVDKKALGTADPKKADQEILDAFKNKDNKKLSKIANTWNTGFDFTKMPSDKDLLVSNGPFKMVDFKENQYLTLERRDDYEGSRKPNVKRVTLRYNEDPTAAVQALQNGEVDAISPQATADILKSVQGIQGVETKTGDDGTYEHIDLVFANGGPFDPKSYGGDAEKAKKVRQAFLLSIPREKIVKDMIQPLNPDAQVRNSFTQVPGSPEYDKIVNESGIKDMYGKQDVAKAKQLLKEAGASSPKVRILYAKDNARRQQEFQLIQEGAKAAGFNVVADADAQWGQHLPQIKDYDASLFGWQSTSTAVTESDANYRTGGQNNFGKYSNKQVDGLYDQLQTELDKGKQADIEGQVEKHLVDDAFGLTLFQFPAVTSYRKSLKGIDPITISPTLFWNYDKWSME